VADQLHDAAPDGIDLYFDNVGGSTCRRPRRAEPARAGCPGAIDLRHNATERPPGRTTSPGRGKRLTLRGFIVFDHYDLAAEFSQTVGDGCALARLHVRETFADGLDNAVSAFIGLLRARNTAR